VISTAFIENLPAEVRLDWVVSSEFEFVLKGHPRIGRLWVYDKKTGFRGWLDLLKTLRSEGYDLHVDLHRSLRTLLAEVWIRIQGGSGEWVRISKERVKTLALFFLKGLLPGMWTPTPYWIRFARAGREVGRRLQGASEMEGALYSPPSLSSSGEGITGSLERYGLIREKYFTVMPASRWSGKEWSADEFLKLIQSLSSGGWVPVLLGRGKDRACIELQGRLNQTGIAFVSLLEEREFLNTVEVLRGAAFYVGCDTGLSHVAEAVGTRAYVIFGPTRPSIGFGPWRKESRALSVPISCAPCSKDGKTCYRFFEPHACMKRLDAKTAEAQMRVP
jgi:heptosyltransferase-2